MITFLKPVVFLSLVIAIFSLVQPVDSQGVGGGDVYIDALVAGCGDGQIEVGEDCDTANLAGQNCATKGFSSGTLSCTASCVFNTSACVLNNGGSGGGGNRKSPNNSATVVFIGKAYPSSPVTILKDGQIIAKTIASPLANFQVSVSGLSGGNYLFAVYGEDNRSLRSAFLTFPIMVSRGTLTKIQDIFVAPTISVDKSTVRRGDTIAIFGQSVPKSTVTLEINSPQQFFKQTPADQNGVYLHNFDSAVLEFGQHTTQSKAATNTEISSKSLVVDFQVGDKNILTPISSSCPIKADLNNDCKINLIDFSIAAFWYQRMLSPAFALREKDHLNGDGKVNLVDFSIMAFHWTG